MKDAILLMRGAAADHDSVVVVDLVCRCRETCREGETYSTRLLIRREEEGRECFSMHASPIAITAVPLLKYFDNHDTG